MKNDSNDKRDEQRVVTPLRSASLGGSTVPGRILIAPWGAVESTNGSFMVDDESAELAVGAFTRHGTDIPIDYEHQTLGGNYASPNGQAPAAGWIKRLTVEAGVGLLADIEWTDQARRMIAAKEYRYLSPVAVIRKTDRKLVAVHSAALTNKPAIRNMQPLVNRVEATDGATEVFARLREELELSEGAEAEEILVAAGQRLAELRESASRQHVEQRIEQAVRAGKLAECQREWAEALIARDEALFDEWLSTAPTIVALGRTAVPSDRDNRDGHNRAVVARAKAAFRTNPLLARLTSEEAFITDAMRESDATAAFVTSD